MMTPSLTFTAEETELLTDAQFFRKKAAISAKIRSMLEATHGALQQELAGLSLVVPPNFDPTVHQLVKGEHLEEFPYQYLIAPNTFAARTSLHFVHWCGGGITWPVRSCWKARDRTI